VFLILPDYVNRLVGLATDPLRIICLTIDTVMKFLESETDNAWAQVPCVDGGAVVPKRLRDLGELVKIQHPRR